MIQILKLNFSKLSLTIAFLFPIFVYLSIWSENKIFFIIISITLFLAIFLTKIKLFLISIFVFLIILIPFLIIDDSKIIEKINGEYKILEKNNFGVVIENKGHKILIKTNNSFSINDVVFVEGITSEIKNYDNFDLSLYLKASNIFNIIEKPKTIELIYASNDIRNELRNFLNTGPSFYSQIVPLLFLGEKNDLTKNIYDQSINLNITHLFVVSGFHFSLLFLICFKLLVFLKVNPKFATFISLMPIIIYLFFLNFPISALRASLIIFLSILNKEFLKKRFNNLDLLSFSMLLMLIWKPFSIYSLSFILSYISTYGIFLINNIHFKNHWSKNIGIIFLIYLLNLPISIYLNNSLSIFGLFWSVAFTPIVVLMYCFIWVLWPWKEGLNYLCYAFIWILNSISEINIIINLKIININILLTIYSILISTIIITYICDFYMVQKTSWLVKKLKKLRK